ncbi:hypothetical protein MXB_4933, partial [Myxobolus squamalis]
SKSLIQTTWLSKQTLSEFYLYFRQLLTIFLNECNDNIGETSMVIELENSNTAKKKYH